MKLEWRPFFEALPDEKQQLFSRGLYAGTVERIGSFYTVTIATSPSGDRLQNQSSIATAKAALEQALKEAEDGV